MDEGKFEESIASVIDWMHAKISSLIDITEEDQKYGLVYDLDDDKEILRKAVEIVQSRDKEEWREKKNRFLNDKIDLTKYMIERIEEFAKK